MPVEVVLRDFDDSRTIFPTILIISNVEADLGAAAGKVHVNTDEKDDQGRVAYAEQR
jgi:hypothetical protein